MWKCLNCTEDVGDELAVCWNCEADKSGALPNGTRSSDDTNEDVEFKRFLNKKHTSKTCTACQSELTFVGAKAFHEGGNFGGLGGYAELFVDRTNLEMYACPTCLRVEFFLSDPII